jgi:hypothetical protein
MEIKKYSKKLGSSKFAVFEALTLYHFNNRIRTLNGFGLHIQHPGTKGNSGDVELLLITPHSSDTSIQMYSKWEAKKDFNEIENNMKVQENFLDGDKDPNIWWCERKAEGSFYYELYYSKADSLTNKAVVPILTHSHDIFNATIYTLLIGNSWDNIKFQWANKIPGEIICLEELINRLYSDIQKFRIEH